MDHILEFLSVAGEENCARPRPVSDPNDISLEEMRAIWGGREGLVVSPVTRGLVGYRGLVETYRRKEELAIGTILIQKQE